MIDLFHSQDAFRLLAPPSSSPRPLSPVNPDDTVVMTELNGLLGPFFAARVSPDAEWAKTLLSGGMNGDL